MSRRVSKQKQSNITTAGGPKGVNVPEINSMKNEDDLLEIITHQTEYIDQLEKENKFLKEELSSFKRRLEDVVRENQVMHDGLRSEIINQTINKASIVASENAEELANEQEEYFSKKLDSVYGQEDDISSEKRSRDQALKQWKQEMENIKAIYEAKIEGLESEVKMTKKNYENALDDAEGLRERLAKMDSLLRMPGSVSESTRHLGKEPINVNVNLPLIERLTKERDDLMKSVASMRGSFLEAQKVESNLRQEVQRSLAMVEDIQLEKAQLKVETDRLKKDLDLTRQRLEAEISSSQKQVAEASMHQRRACQNEMDELLKKVGELTAMITTYENNLEAAGREKSALTIQLDDARRQLLIANEDLGKMRSEIEFEVRSTIKGYKGAEDELRNTELKLKQEITKMDQERVRLEQESVEQQRRLSAAQTEALASNELNVTLTQQLNDALHRLQDLRQEKDKLEKEITEELQMVTTEAKEKEERLVGTIHKSEIEYEQRISDLESISSKQFNLITRLKEEGQKMEIELKKLTKKYRKQVGALSQDKEMATAKLSRIVAANKELEEQVVQHGITHREMQLRLRELDERTRRSEVYATTMLEENDRLVQDKSMLEKEVNFLQSQVLPSEKT